MNWGLVLVQVLRNIRTIFTRRVAFWLIIGLGCIIGFSSLVVWIFERSSTSPDALQNLGEVIWWVVAILIGISDPSFFPATVGGKTVGVLLNAFDIIFLSILTTFLVSIVVDTIIKESRGMGSTSFKNHVLICGWNETAREIIRQLHSKEVAHPKDIVVLAERVKNPISDPSVHCLRGNPCLEADLRRANVQEADAAVIFPTDDTDQADAQSLLVALAIETLNPDVYTVVQAVHARNREHFLRANVDEVFAMGELGSHLLARSVLHHGLSHLIAELLHNDAGNEFYRVPLPASCVDQTFNDILARWREEHNVILLAVQRDDKTFVNPKGEFILQAGDECLVIAWDPPRLG